MIYWATGMPLPDRQAMVDQSVLIDRCDSLFCVSVRIVRISSEE